MEGSEVCLALPDTQGDIGTKPSAPHLSSIGVSPGHSASERPRGALSRDHIPRATTARLLWQAEDSAGFECAAAETRRSRLTRPTPPAWRLDDSQVVAAKVCRSPANIGGVGRLRRQNTGKRTESDLNRDTVVMTTRVVRSKSVDIQGFRLARDPHRSRSRVRDDTRQWRVSQTRVSYLGSVPDPGGYCHDVYQRDLRVLNSATSAMSTATDTFIGIASRRPGPSTPMRGGFSNREVLKRLGHLGFTLESCTQRPSSRHGSPLGESPGDVHDIDPSAPAETTSHRHVRRMEHCPR